MELGILVAVLVVGPMALAAICGLSEEASKSQKANPTEFWRNVLVNTVASVVGAALFIFWLIYH